MTSTRNHCVGFTFKNRKNNSASRSAAKFYFGTISLLVALMPGLAQESFILPGTGQIPPAPKPATTSKVATSAVAPAAVTNAPENFINRSLPDFLANGKLNINARLRYEQVDEANQKPFTKDSYAPTLRTRLGFTTAPLYGFQAMVEGVNVTAFGALNNYNAASANNQPARPPVNDPEVTRLDQAWLKYSYTNIFTAKVGRQQINLDNQRFIGDAGWRQNFQTYDAATTRVTPLKNLDIVYGYVWEVNRVFGGGDRLPAANTDFDSHSHLINVAYSGWKYGRFVGYAYLLDLQNAAGAANSCATYGGYFAGAAPVTDWMTVDYRAEFAWQTEYADSPLRYDASYYNFEAAANIQPVAFGAGYEVLGSGANSGAGGGRVGFQTPLASPHPFNGWAEMFVKHPANGLRDLYGFVQVTLPAQIPVRFAYHTYDADFGSSNFGQEFDVLATKKFGKHWSVLLEYADYLGRDAAPPAFTGKNVDVQKFWAAVEFNF
jgi:hypothetical protein